MAARSLPNFAPPAHINDVRRVDDVLTPSRARVNASSNSPVEQAYITFTVAAEKFWLNLLCEFSESDSHHARAIGIILANTANAHPTLTQ